MYADILFLTEFMNDYLILVTVSHMTGYHTRRKKIIFSALCGAAVSTMLALFKSHAGTFFNLSAGILLCLLMIIIGFSPHSRRDYLRFFLYTYATAFILGGIVNFINEKLPGIPVLVIFLVGFVFLQTGIKLASLINQKGLKICTVRVSFPNEIKCFLALIDTGNMLYDEQSALPVSIINKISIPDFEENRVHHHIPFKSLGCEHGTLEIIYVPYMCIEYEGRKKLIENAPLGLSNNQLSNTDAYQMIISPEIIY